MNLIITRGKTVALEELPPYSIAIDGFVKGPIIDNENHRYSFDHHENCLRFCTLASCQQALTAVLAGLSPENYNIFINDVDSDTCMAVWCLQNPQRCVEPLVQKLVGAIGILDAHCGAIPVNGMTKTVEWICAPETDSKRNQDYHKLSDDGLQAILEAVLHRVDCYVNGEASIEIAKQCKHGEYKILRNENGWVLVESQDPHVYGALYHAGFDRVVLVRPQQDKSLAISLAKKSDFIDDFPLFKLYEALNKVESGWGGSSTSGGAPRHPDGSRSHLPLETIIAVVDQTIVNTKS